MYGVSAGHRREDLRTSPGRRDVRGRGAARRRMRARRDDEQDDEQMRTGRHSSPAPAGRRQFAVGLAADVDLAVLEIDERGAAVGRACRTGSRSRAAPWSVLCTRRDSGGRPSPCRSRSRRTSRSRSGDTSSCTFFSASWPSSLSRNLRATLRDDLHRQRAEHHGRVEAVAELGREYALERLLAVGAEPDGVAKANLAVRRARASPRCST